MGVCICVCGVLHSESIDSGVDEDTIGTRNIFLDYVQKSKVVSCVCSTMQ